MAMERGATVPAEVWARKTIDVDRVLVRLASLAAHLTDSVDLKEALDEALPRIGRLLGSQAGWVWLARR